MEMMEKHQIHIKLYGSGLLPLSTHMVTLHCLLKACCSASLSLLLRSPHPRQELRQPTLHHHLKKSMIRKCMSLRLKVLVRTLMLLLPLPSDLLWLRMLWQIPREPCRRPQPHLRQVLPRCHSSSWPQKLQQLHHCHRRLVCLRCQAHRQLLSQWTSRRKHIDTAGLFTTAQIQQLEEIMQIMSSRTRIRNGENGAMGFNAGWEE